MFPSPVTIAVVTFEQSFIDFADFLKELLPAIKNYSSECELLVVNNSGAEAASITSQIIIESKASEICSVRVIASQRNNIATARNIALQEAKNDLLVFMDDDGFPVPKWLHHLTSSVEHHSACLVAGPTLPIYLFKAPNWVKTVDLHNASGRETGQVIKISTAGNLMMKRSALNGALFNESYGESGGEDTEFLIRMHQDGLKLIWCSEAAVYEYIPEHKSSAKYFMKRFIVQGQLYRQLTVESGEIKHYSLFMLKSVVVLAISSLVVPVLVAISSQHAGFWVKRALLNLGHLSHFSKKLYPSAE